MDRRSIGKNTASAKALRQRSLGESEDWKVGGGAGSREEGEVVSWVGERGVVRPQRPCGCVRGFSLYLKSNWWLLHSGKNRLRAHVGGWMQGNQEKNVWWWF